MDCHTFRVLLTLSEHFNTRNVAAQTLCEAAGKLLAVSPSHLVNPVPDEAPLQAVHALDGFPVLVDAPVAVAHGMRIPGKRHQRQNISKRGTGASVTRPDFESARTGPSFYLSAS
jgi:hypothetical protein